MEWGTAHCWGEDHADSGILKVNVLSRIRGMSFWISELYTYMKLEFTFVYAFLA